MRQYKGGVSEAIGRVGVHWVQRLLRSFLVGMLVLSLISCTLSREELTTEVRNALQTEFDQNTRFREYELNIQELMLFKEEGNRYSGLAQIAYKDKVYPVKLKVKVDGRQYMWETEEDAFNFVLQHELNSLGQNLLEELGQSLNTP